MKPSDISKRAAELLKEHKDTGDMKVAIERGERLEYFRRLGEDK